MNLKIKATIEKRNSSEPSILEGGLLKIKPASIDYAKLIVNELKQYKNTEIEVAFNDTESYSNRVNNLFHSLIRDIVDADAVQFWQLLGRAPIGFDEVKEWAKVQFGGAEVKIVGSLSFIESWTKFTKKRALQCIDNMINYCAEMDVNIDKHQTERNDLGGNL